MVENVYQIVEENQFDIKLIQASLEDATDVLYTKEELERAFNNGEPLESACCSKKSYAGRIVANSCYYPHTLIYVHELTNYVQRKFGPKNKCVVVALSEEATNQMFYLRPYFLEHGFRWSSKQGGFIKASKPKPKPIETSKYTMNSMRIFTCDRISDWYNKGKRFEICFKFRTTIESQSQMIAMAKSHGFKLSMLGEIKPTETDKGIPAIWNKSSYYRTDLTADENAKLMLLNKKAIQDWFKSC